MIRAEDVIRHAWQTTLADRQRSALTLLGILVGIASVILMTSIGEGLRGYVLREFTQFGTNLVAVNPGRAETSGIPGVGGTVRKLTIEDNAALLRLPGVAASIPVAMGTGPVEREGRKRDVFVYGVTAGAPAAWSMAVRQGEFLPKSDARRGAAVAVLGPTLKRELFGNANALGEHVRIAGTRFLVIGIMESKGQFLGFDIDDAAYIPVARAMALFDTDELMEIDVLVANTSRIDSTAARMRRVLMDRRGGEEDFTITTQTGMMETLGHIVDIVSLAVVGIAAISLFVGALGILTMMWIAVNERTAEIGLIKAIGGTGAQIMVLHLAEAVLLSTTGGVLGLLVGIGLSRVLRFFLPGLPVQTPVVYVALALLICVGVGLLSGAVPARRAARLDPIQALNAE